MITSYASSGRKLRLPYLGDELIHHARACVCVCMYVRTCVLGLTLLEGTQLTPLVTSWNVSFDWTTRCR